MALTQTQPKLAGASGRTGLLGPALVIAAVMVAVISMAIVAANWSSGQSSSQVGTQKDPLVQAPAIQFRADERAVSGTYVDPLVQAPAIQFRRDESEASGVQQVPQATHAAGERYPNGALQVPQKAAPGEITRGELP